MIENDNIRTNIVNLNFCIIWFKKLEGFILNTLN